MGSGMIILLETSEEHFMCKDTKMLKQRELSRTQCILSR